MLDQGDDMSRRISVTARGALLGAALALVAAACGDDDETTSDTTTAAVTTAGGSSATTAGGSTATTARGSTATTAGGSTATTAASGAGGLGTPNPASGEPVRIGYISDGQSAAIDNSDELRMAEATAEYANEYLAGVAGRPIELVTCETKQDAALAVDCANQMVEEGVIAVLFNVSGQSASIAKPLQDANVPLFVQQAADVATDTESTFVFSNALTSFVHPAVVAREEGFTKAAYIVIDVPGATGPVRSLGAGIAAKAGVAAPDIVAIAPGTADMGPQIQAALGNDPELVHVLGDAAFCSTAFQALDAAGYDGTVTAIQQCISDETIDAVGDYLEGVRVGYVATIDPSDPDYETFLAVIDEYAENPDAISRTSNPVGAFATVINFVRIMADAEGDLTQAAAISTAKGAGDLPLALGAGLTFNCDGTAISIVPAVCTAGFVEATLDAEGQPTDFGPVEPGDLQELG